MKIVQTKTRDIIAIFVIAKISSLATAFFVFGLDGEVGKIDLLSHALSIVFFFVLLLFVTKRSGLFLIYGTDVSGPKWGRVIIWVLVCIPLGFVVRFGVEGIYLVMINIYDSRLAINEFNGLIENYDGAQVHLWWMVVVAALVGALDEEFVYRKIFLWHFSKAYGVVAGILITSVIFGAVHWNPVALMAAFCLACTYLASGRLWVVVVVHASGNMFHLLMDPFLINVSWDTYFILSALFSVIISVTMFYFIIEIKERNMIRPIFQRFENGVRDNYQH